MRKKGMQKAGSNTVFFYPEKKIFFFKRYKFFSNLILSKRIM